MDSRFNLKIEFKIYQQTFTWNCSLNWSASEGYIDQRIEQWFLDSYNEAYKKWQHDIYISETEQRKEKQIQEEKAQLKLLKEKYEKPSSPNS